jgi:mono/diheme cytochrome c family protein
MKRTFAIALSTVLAFAFVAVMSTGAPREAAAQAKLDGKAIFMAQKCNLCHTVSSASIQATMKSSKAPDLTNLAAKQDAKVLNDYLRKKGMINGKKHVKDFTGSDEELGALIAWLQAQKK